VSPSALLAVPTTVTADGKSLTLNAVLWRDFFPPNPLPDGGPMVSVVRVQTSDGSAVPTTVTADMIWLVNGTEVWSAVPRQERTREDAAPSYEVVARDGPKWQPGTSVDVIVRLRTRAGVVRLRAAHQLIQVTF
jgi:hypothetical protein